MAMIWRYITGTRLNTADFDGDGDIDEDDLAILATGFGQFELNGDVDKDGDVDGLDLWELTVNYSHNN